MSVLVFNDNEYAKIHIKNEKAISRSTFIHYSYYILNFFRVKIIFGGNKKGLIQIDHYNISQPFWGDYNMRIFNPTNIDNGFSVNMVLLLFLIPPTGMECDLVDLT